MPLHSACVGAPPSSTTRLFFTVIFVVAVACFAEVQSLEQTRQNIEKPPVIAQDATGQDLGPAVILAIGCLRECSEDFTTSSPHTLKRSTRQPSAAYSVTALVEVSCSLQLVNNGRNGNNDQSDWMQGPLQNQPLVISGIHPLDCMLRSQDVSSSLSDAPYLFLLKSTGHSRQAQSGHVTLQVVEQVQLLDTLNPGWALPTQASQDRCQQLAAGIGLVTNKLNKQPLSPHAPVKCSEVHNHKGLQGTDGGSLTARHALGPVTRLQRQLLQLNRTELVPSAVDAASDVLRSVADRASTAADRLASRAASMQAVPSGNATGSAAPSNASGDGANASSQSSGQQQGAGVVPQELAGNIAGVDAVNNSATVSSPTLNSTQDTNSTAARLTCLLQLQEGPCRAMIPRWAFDLATGACREFLYGGCDGNANNFASRQDCENACANATGDALNARTPVTPAQPPLPPPAPPAGPVSTTVDEPRVLTGGSTSGAKSNKGVERSFAEKLCRVALAGAVAALTFLLL